MLKRFLYKQFKNIFPKKLLFFNGDRKSNRVALTFDDGPCPENIEEILKILRKDNIKATFFMTGKAVEQYKELFVKVVREGHEIGNHLYRHKSVTNLAYGELVEEITGCKDAINKISFKNNFPQLLRPPHGQLDLKTLWYAWRNKWTIVLWSVDSRDLKGKSLKDNIKILEQSQIKAGDIILLHEDSHHITEIIKWIIDEAQSKDLKFCTIGELLAERF